MGVHDGHRERLRWRFIEHGLKNFNELNSLELLLFFAIPRRDTNELAHTLLARFGTLAGVFDASYEELTSVPGVGENAAALIMLVPQILKKSYVARGEETAYITNSTEAGKYLVPRFMFEKDEIALLLCLDTQKRVLSCTEIGRGVVNAVNASPRKVVETALKSAQAPSSLRIIIRTASPFPRGRTISPQSRSIPRLSLSGSRWSII